MDLKDKIELLQLTKDNICGAVDNLRQLKDNDILDSDGYVDTLKDIDKVISSILSDFRKEYYDSIMTEEELERLRKTLR